MSRLRRNKYAGAAEGASVQRRQTAPGKRALTDSLVSPVQRKTPAAAPVPQRTAPAARDAGEGAGAWDASDFAEAAGLDWLISAPAVQRKGDGASAIDVHAEAAAGVAGASTALPHADRIQESFGRHDVSHVQAHVGGDAATAAQAIGAEAYATGDHVAFAESPSLHTAAHEAAHVVQQRTGVQLRGGVGAAGDRYEQQADEVADAVVRGDSAAAILDADVGGGPNGPRHGVQRKVDPGGSLADSGPRGEQDISGRDMASQPAPLSASVDMLRFGSIALGQESELQVVTVTNVGPSPIEIEDVAPFPTPSPAFPTYGAIAGAIAPGDSTDISFAFRPLKEGPQNIVYQIITAGGVASVRIQIEGTGVSDERSEVPLLAARPRKLDLPRTMVGEWSESVPVVLTNEGRQPITIDDLQLDGPRASDFAILGEADGAAIQPGSSAGFEIAFKPEEQRNTSKPHLRKATLLVKANEGATAAKIRLRGLAEPAREKSEEEHAVEDGEKLYKAASADDAPAARVGTYRDMLASLLAAQRFTELGDAESYRRASRLVVPVDERMNGLARTAEEKLRDYGSAFSTGVAIFGRAHSAVYEWKHRLQDGASINANFLVTTFQVGEEAIKLATGELNDAPNLRTLERGGRYTAIGVAGVATAAVAAPLLIELAPVLASEGALLWESGKWIAAEVGVWALANPESAVVLSELLLGLGITIGEGGWDGFAQQFETPEGFFFFLLQLAQDAMHLEQTNDAGPLPGGRRSAGNWADVADPPSRAPVGDHEASGDRARAPEGLRHESDPDLGPEAARVRDLVIERAGEVIDTVANLVNDGRQRTVPASPPRGRPLPEVKVSVADLEISDSVTSNEWMFSIQARLPSGRVQLIAHGSAMIENGAPAEGPSFVLEKDVKIDGAKHKVQIYDTSDDRSGNNAGESAPMSLTDLTLKEGLSLFERRFGHKPDVLPGHLVHENRRHFYQRYLELLSEGIDEPAARNQAIRATAFGTHRMAHGYGDFQVELTGPPQMIDLGPPYGLRELPGSVDVVARRSDK